MQFVILLVNCLVTLFSSGNLHDKRVYKLFCMTSYHCSEHVLLFKTADKSFAVTFSVDI